MNNEEIATPRIDAICKDWKILRLVDEAKAIERELVKVKDASQIVTLDLLKAKQAELDAAKAEDHWVYSDFKSAREFREAYKQELYAARAEASACREALAEEARKCLRDLPQASPED